ncbi:GDSL lipase/esterase protein [Dioscorea alata]|uniref:GDSL lipase/esterase protein n=1 Tax=Dioscorea alata TaxID=55571 RepID=A0ACB7WGE3_DIOAL|nr:GDSL lipase/esterase protein [Dioscorea alata]
MRILTEEFFCISSSLTASPPIISFGGSLSDTGNLLHHLHNNCSIAHSPYGITFFHHPTGRHSDGRLIIDFLAEAIGLPFLPPYLAGPAQHNFQQGVNFAIGGGTMAETSFYKENGFPLPNNTFSLHDQLNWLCEAKLGNSLFIVGAIGGNDYHIAMLKGSSDYEIETLLVPVMIQAISSAIKDLIKYGARTLVVPGNYPVGCLSASLTYFPREGDYDQKTGCLNWLNELTEFYNQRLHIELQDIQHQHPHVTIFFVDYYGIIMEILRSPKKYGFKDKPLVACCGGGGPYNYNADVLCGEGARACDDPTSSVFWDGVHLTETANKIIATDLLQVLHVSPSINQQLPHIVKIYDQAQHVSMTV